MNLNPNIPHGSDWQSLANYKFNLQKNSLDKKLIANELEIKTDTLQRHLNGTIRNEGDFIRDFTKVVLKYYPDELEFITFFLPPGFIVIQENKIKKDSSESIRDKEISLSILIGKAIDKIEKALKDGKLEKTEMAKIDFALTRLQSKAAELREKLKREIE